MQDETRKVRRPTEGHEEEKDSRNEDENQAVKSQPPGDFGFPLGQVQGRVPSDSCVYPEPDETLEQIGKNEAKGVGANTSGTEKPRDDDGSYCQNGGGDDVTGE